MVIYNDSENSPASLPLPQKFFAVKGRQRERNYFCGKGSTAREEGLSCTAVKAYGYMET